MKTNTPSFARRCGRRWGAAACLGLAAVLSGAPAAAQVRLPPLGGLPGGNRLPPLPVQETVQPLLPLQEVRLDVQRELLRRHPDRLDTDPAGQPVRRGELIWIAPTPAGVQAAVAQGFSVLRDEVFAELDLRQVILRTPPGVTLADAARRLRALEPGSTVDYNHLYGHSGDTRAHAAAPTASSSAPTTPRRVGLIDGGVDRQHPAFAQAHIHTSGCNGKALASAHGTAVASLLVGRDGVFSGLQPQAELFAADVYCEEPDGGSAEDVARALAWLVRERVPVINISLVGPPNALLERAVQAVLRRGHLVVAAVGNDGPAAPPLYPASYPGVVGVSGVTPKRRVLPEAARGPQVSLSAPGAEVAAARAGGGYVSARGTSFAAPIVAGLLAETLREPDVAAAAAALLSLQRGATDLGAAGRDDVYGFGLVGESARTAPERVSTRRP
jgi:subtilisin family serine protease